MHLASAPEQDGGRGVPDQTDSPGMLFHIQGQIPKSGQDVEGCVKASPRGWGKGIRSVGRTAQL